MSFDFTFRRIRAFVKMILFYPELYDYLSHFDLVLILEHHSKKSFWEAFCFTRPIL